MYVSITLRNRKQDLDMFLILSPFRQGEKIVITLVFDDMADSGGARLATLAPADSSLEIHKYNG